MDLDREEQLKREIDKEFSQELLEEERTVEALLFTLGRSVSVEEIAIALDKGPVPAKDAAERLYLKYQERQGGILIDRLEGKYQMSTNPTTYQDLIRLAKAPKKPVLTDVIMETLAIITYKQPITKGEIERIRGVKSDHAVNKLVEYGLVEEAGRLDTPGRPVLFATTEEFLRRFSIESLGDLPKLSDDVEKAIEMEVSKEVAKALGDIVELEEEADTHEAGEEIEVATDHLDGAVTKEDSQQVETTLTAKVKVEANIEVLEDEIAVVEEYIPERKEEEKTEEKIEERLILEERLEKEGLTLEDLEEVGVEPIHLEDLEEVGVEPIHLEDSEEVGAEPIYSEELEGAAEDEEWLEEMIYEAAMEGTEEAKDLKESETVSPKQDDLDESVIKQDFGVKESAEEILDDISNGIDADGEKQDLSPSEEDEITFERVDEDANALSPEQ